MVTIRVITVEKYLASLPDDKRSVLEVVRAVILKNLPKGYEETMQYGMISYVVPLKIFPEGYLKNPEHPLPYIALAAQKNYFSLYLMALYADKKDEDWFRKAYKASGKKLDMGKSCVRFKKIEDLPLDIVGEAVALTPVKEHIAHYIAAKTKK